MADPAAVRKYIEERFDPDFLEPLKGFIEIPNLTPAFDPEYLTNGLIEKAIKYTLDFADSLKIPGLTHHVHNEDGKPPMVAIVYPGERPLNVMFYGHLDKQPHMTEGWSEGLGPCKPVVRGDLLYGRGSCDDGYAPFAALMAIKANIAQGTPLPRTVIVLECEEESGSHYLLHLLEAMKDVIKTPDVCICLDAGTANYTGLWVTSSLRGMVAVNVKAQSVANGEHSGTAGGIVPETFSALRVLLDRIEDAKTGRVVDLFQSPCPPEKQAEADHMAELSKEKLYDFASFLDGCGPMHLSDLSDMYLANVWRSSLAVTGCNGMPSISNAGNVLRPFTEVRLSLRLPPNKDSKSAAQELVKLLTKDPPHNCQITLSGLSNGDGYMWRKYEDWVYAALDEASKHYFGEDKAGTFGTGGSIPFLTQLGKLYPTTQIIALGAMGPTCKAHNPDENMHIPHMRKLIGCLAHLVAECGNH